MRVRVRVQVRVRVVAQALRAHQVGEVVAAQVDGQRARASGEAAEPSLGFIYFTDHYAAHAPALLQALRQRWPGLAWAGTVGVGVAAGGVEYFDDFVSTLTSYIGS